MESIFHFGSCYLHQNRFSDPHLYDIDNIALMITAVVLLVVTIAAIAVESSAGNRPVNA
jgi:hypothetical protein